MSSRLKHYARRPHQYLERDYDFGQAIEIRGTKNDETLIRLGFIALIPKDTVLSECGACGGWFIKYEWLAMHFKDRHGERFLSTFDEQVRDDQHDAFLDELAPIHFDKTKASREATT
ncbi:MAG TPA: hypothetical protein VF290_22160 [Pyrinomonadaceae bacterium]